MKYILFLISLAFFLPDLMGQKEERIYRHYSTQKVQARLLKEDAKTAKEQSKIERHIANFKLVGQIKEVTIPVIFHILHNQNEERISEEQIYSQLEALNKDFTISIIDEGNKHPADIAEDFGKHVPEKLGIQFCLAEVKQGNTIGINYVSTNVREWGDDDAIKDKKTGGIAPIQSDKYLNIWVGNLADSVSGYAQMPGGPDKTDGIVIDYEFFGTMGTAKAPYNMGKTLTHLVGSYLGLYELWNETVPCGNDYVDDTPIHNGPNFGPTNTYKHISLCNGYPIEMSMNFMDNSDDNYLYLFTVGQMLRMQALLNKGGARQQLTNSNTRCAIQQQFANNRDSELNTILSNADAPILNIHPNPARDLISIELKGEITKGSMAIYSAAGRLMHHRRELALNGGQSIQLNIQDWAAGIYFIHAYLNGESKSYRFAVSK